MLGTVILSPRHRGTLYSEGQFTYALLNGQHLSRAAYSDLDTAWPSGLYGSTDTTIVLPDFDATYLRGFDRGALRDPSLTARVAWSGVSPSGTSLGSYQFGALKAHEHVSGYSNSSSTGGPDSRAAAPLAFVTTSSISILSTVVAPTIKGTSDQTTWQPPNYSVYPYLIISS